ncbi:hypothetical protein EA14781_142_00050 [Escherichia albertii NBRC 107761 = DSM 17582]|nr:hypothetical protein EA14781_142_00050 [Escherichia albertii NBRC 107761 = DSM 17582]
MTIRAKWLNSEIFIADCTMGSVAADIESVLANWAAEFHRVPRVLYGFPSPQRKGNPTNK